MLLGIFLVSKLYVTFIIQWIAFIFGRDEEDQKVCHMHERQLSLSSLYTIYYLPWRPLLVNLLKNPSIMPLGVFMLPEEFRGSI